MYMGVIRLNLTLSEIFKKYANNKSMYIIIIIGIVFMLLPGFGAKHSDNINARSYDAYSDEERLRGILSKIDGVGEVSVMITYYGTTSYEVAFEQKQDSSKSEKETTTRREDSVITSGGAPMVKGEVYPKAKGVVIIAEGASDARVKKSITDAACAALELASCKVCVLEGKERN